MRHPVLEIGDEGVHLIVVEAWADGRGDPGNGVLEPLVREERALRIGAAIDREGTLSGGTAELVIETVRRLARRARDAADRAPRTLLTGALAATADDALLDRIAEAAGSGPRRLLPEEDTRLAFLGATIGVRDPRTPVVLLRLRAEQLQLALGRDGDVLWTAEAELGTDLLIRTFGFGADRDGAALDEPTVDALASTVRERLRGVAAPVHHRPRAWRLVAGGTVVRHLAAAIATARRDETPSHVHRIPLGFPELLYARTRFDSDGALCGTTARGLPMSRGDEPLLGTRLAVAATVLAEVADAFGVDDIMVSEWGAREAVVLETVGAAAEPTADREVRRRSVRRLVETLASDPPHAEHVARLAVGLFDGTSELHGLGTRARELLEHAARLHDVGACISPAAQHRTGAAFLEKATLPGFPEEDLAVLACLVRFHKGTGPSPGYEPLVRLSGERRRAVAHLTALLRVADGLERGHDGAVEQIASHVGERLVRLVIDGHENLEMARWGATAAAPFFERIFGRELEVIVRRPHPIVHEGLLLREDLRT